jgi:hypothetical protein
MQLNDPMPIADKVDVPTPFLAGRADVDLQQAYQLGNKVGYCWVRWFPLFSKHCCWGW